MEENQYLATVMICLKDRNKKAAAKLLWPEMIMNEQTLRIWDAMEKYPFLCIMGHGSASKSYTAAAFMLLEWWAHCGESAIVITSDTIPSMSRRIWSDIKALHASAKVKMPGILIDSRKMIKPTPIDEKNTIAGIAAEADDAQSKIQGVHTKFIRVVIDEADNRFAGSVWKAISNLETSGDLRCVALANPADISGLFGQHCEPMDGWSSVNPEADHEWDSKKGWHVLRLDGLRSPNIVLGHDKYPFLLTNKGVAGIREKAGENSPLWWSYVRAWFPPEGSIGTIFSAEITDRADKLLTFYGKKIPCASLDPAFEGGDACVLTLGHRGRLAEAPKKSIVEVSEWILIKRQDTKVPITIDYARQVIQICKRKGVTPDNFIMDKTGNALGLHDVIALEWSRAITGIEFGQSCTEMKIAAEDTQKAVDRFDRFVSELWYSAREWMRVGLVHLIQPPKELIFELHSRTYEMRRDLIRIQTKDEMKELGLSSPDYADSFCLMIHLARLRANGFVPSSSDVPRGERDDDPLAKFKKKSTTLQPSYGQGGEKAKSRLPGIIWNGPLAGTRVKQKAPRGTPTENASLKGGPM